MFRIHSTPQRSDLTTAYTTDGETLIVTGQTTDDQFDFSILDDGDIATDFISTTLSVCPILSAECETIDGERVITVHVISWYGADATDELKRVREVIL